MFLRSKKRFKDGKEHRYWSVVESRRGQSGKVSQQQVLYLGEINDSQKSAWCRAIEVFDDHRDEYRPIALFPSDRKAPLMDCDVVQIRLSELTLHRPRQWGGCWLALSLWSQLKFDEFWASRLPPSRKGTSWLNVLKTLVCYRLIDPGSEWRLHRQWFKRSAIAQSIYAVQRLPQDGEVGSPIYPVVWSDEAGWEALHGIILQQSIVQGISRNGTKTYENKAS